MSRSLMKNGTRDGDVGAPGSSGRSRRGRQARTAHRGSSNHLIVKMVHSGTIEMGTSNGKGEEAAREAGREVLGTGRSPPVRAADRVEDPVPDADTNRARGVTHGIAPRAFDSPGRPLDRTLRAHFEGMLHRDFSKVRVHTSSKAGRTARALRARAFAYGQHIVFGQNQYRPHATGGQALLAHELVHIGQRTAEPRPVVRRDPNDDPTPEELFVQDLQSGTDQAQEYVQYISDAVEYWRQYGRRPSGLDRAVENLGEITSRVNDGLDRFAGALDMASQAVGIRDWFQEVDNFAAATSSLDFGDRASVRRWADSAEDLRQKTQPFVDSTREWLTRLARSGSPAAARGAFFLSVLSAYAEVSAAALQAGVRNVNAYFERRDPYVDDAEAAEARRRRRARIPPPPRYPGDWYTEAELIQSARERAEARRRLRERREQERRAREARREFDEQVFPRIYRRNRRRIRRRILRDIVRGRPGGRIRFRQGGRFERGGTARLPGSDARRWWDQLASAPGRRMRIRGISVSRTKRRVTRTEAEQEIYRLELVTPPCPYFDELYETELEAYLQNQLER